MDAAVASLDRSLNWPSPDWAALRPRMVARADEVDDLMALLMAHASVGVPAAECRELARLLACASLGDRHLWQDLGLNSRDELTALIAHAFPALAAANHQNMKWKKFFYRQLCLREEILICKSPTCTDCSDQSKCFGPEVPEEVGPTVR